MHNWARKLVVVAPPKSITHTISPAARIDRADLELVSLLKRLRARGCALHLREVIALRAAQMLHDPQLAIAVMNRRRPKERVVADYAAIAATRAQVFDSARIAAAEAASTAVAAAKRQSVFMSEAWASRFLSNHGFTLRRVTSGHISDAVDQVRVSNQRIRVAQAIGELKILSPDWIFNMDETGYIISKSSDTTFAVRGEADAPVNGHSQREQVTVVETVCMNGKLLARQVIFAGSSKRVFPAPIPGLSYAFSKSHWANADTMVAWFDDVLLPHLKLMRETPTYKDQHALLLIDAYSAHFNEKFLCHAAKHKVRVLQIEPCLTSVLQPCDHRCGPNRNIKPIVYKLNDFAFVKSVIESMKRSADSVAAAAALEKFNGMAYNFKLVDRQDQNVVVN